MNLPIRYKKILECLLKHDIDVMQLNKENKTALDIAATELVNPDNDYNTKDKYQKINAILINHFQNQGRSHRSLTIRRLQRPEKLDDKKTEN